MTSTTSKWTIQFIKDSRHRGDPLADEAAEEIIHSSETGKLHEILRKFATNDQEIPDGLPQDVVDFFEKSGHVEFSEEDKAKLDKASEIFYDYGPMVVFALLFRALPVTYMANAPAHVLTISRLLEDFPERRIIETAQFVFDVLEEKWYEPGKRGIRTAQKVRLMHAGMRHLLSHESHDKWNDEWGTPISQGDLLATLQTFSLEVLRGLELLHIHLEPEEEDAWFFAWTKIGMIMGVEEDLMPTNRAEAEHVQELIYQLLFTHPVVPGDPGPILIKSLVECMKTITDSKFFSSHVLVILRYMIHNDHWYKYHLKLPSTPKDEFFLWLLKTVMHIYGFLARFGLTNQLVTKVSHDVLMAIYNAKRGGKAATFIVPKSLEQLYNLERRESQTSH